VSGDSDFTHIYKISMVEVSGAGAIGAKKKKKKKEEECDKQEGEVVSAGSRKLSSCKIL
jgi:hypothetical protein